MRTCTNCGAQFPDDELICPVCGHEVQLVPDYVTIESKIQEDKKRKEDEEQRRREEMEREQAIEKRKQQIRRKILLLIVLIAAAAAAVIITSVSLHLSKQHGSFAYQYEKAQSSYEIGDYDDALSYITKALKIDADNDDGLYLEAEIYAALKKNSDAESVLEKLISGNGDYTRAYDLLIKLYTADRNSDAIRTLLKNCKNKKVLAKYENYLPKAPTITPEGGTYNDIQTITIESSDSGTIYYTTDDSTPDLSSSRYTGSFKLKEGTTTVKAIVVTDKGLTSETSSQEFSIELDTPSAPKITPESGTYTHLKGKSSSTESVSSSSDNDTDTDVTHITVTVPDGYTCYYAFDQTPTKSSNKYTKPVSMRQGEHIFYAVLCSRDGKLGKVASATYIYSVVTPTATPTPTVTPTQEASNTYNPANVYNSETVATPTPTEAATPTPTATPTPEASSSTSSANSENREQTGSESTGKESDKAAEENTN